MIKKYIRWLAYADHTMVIINNMSRCGRRTSWRTIHLSHRKHNVNRQDNGIFFQLVFFSSFYLFLNVQVRYNPINWHRVSYLLICKRTTNIHKLQTTSYSNSKMPIGIRINKIKTSVLNKHSTQYRHAEAMISISCWLNSNINKSIYCGKNSNKMTN